LNPLDGNQFTGPWHPPTGKTSEIEAVSRNQGTPENAFQVLDLRNFMLYVYGSNVAANTFGPVMQIPDTMIGIIGMNTITNEAVLAIQSSQEFGPTTIVQANLGNGTVKMFSDGLGSGNIQGIAVDSADNIACTTSYGDSSVEFYDLTQQSGFSVALPNCSSPACSAFDVEFDPINKLFLVAQPISSLVENQSTIYVYTPQGGMLEALNGFNFYTQRFDVFPVHIAIHPTDRSGFVDVTTQLGWANFNHLRTRCYGVLGICNSLPARRRWEACQRVRFALGVGIWLR
jgi:hypothetical protein